MIVFDESHYLKTYSSTRTKRAMYMARQAPYVVCLSATPAPNGYIDLYYQIKMVDRKSTRLNSSHVAISYAVFCLKKKRSQKSAHSSSSPSSSDSSSQS